jgi:hypothetical protein
MASTSGIVPSTTICDGKNEINFSSQTKVKLGSQECSNFEIDVS